MFPNTCVRQLTAWVLGPATSIPLRWPPPSQVCAQGGPFALPPPASRPPLRRDEEPTRPRGSSCFSRSLNPEEVTKAAAAALARPEPSEGAVRARGAPGASDVHRALGAELSLKFCRTPEHTFFARQTGEKRVILIHSHRAVVLAVVIFLFDRQEKRSATLIEPASCVLEILRHTGSESLVSALNPAAREASPVPACFRAFFTLYFLILI